MMKTKKSGLLVIFALALVLALSCGAWALQTTTLTGNAGTATAVDDIETNGANVHGARAMTVGTVQIHGFDVTTLGATSHGLYTYTNATDGGNKIYMSNGIISTATNDSRGAYATVDSYISLDAVQIKTKGNTARGVEVALGSSMDITGSSILTEGTSANGIYARSNGKIYMTGDIVTSNDSAVAVLAAGGSYISLNGTVETKGVGAYGVQTTTDNDNGASSIDMTGSITTAGERASGIVTSNFSTVNMAGDITVNGPSGYGLWSYNNGTSTMKNGTLTIANDDSSGIKLETGGVATLTSVDVVAATLFETVSDGILNATDSTLTGDILHLGTGGSAGAVAVNLKDSTLEGAVLASQGLGNRTGGTIDLTLDNSTWIVTGDTNTNGAVVSSGDSAIDTTLAPDGTVTAIDELVGVIDINVKPGDTLQVDNADGNNSFTSSDPDVIEVTQNANGSWTIVSKSEGTADLTYTYVDENGVTQTVTSSVVSGSGVKPDAPGGSGGSSGCNAGFGVLALLGLAFVYKKK